MDRLAANRTELTEHIDRAIHVDGTIEPMPGLHLNRATRPDDKVYGASRPSLCVIAQGAKEVYLGSSRYPYDEHHYLLATVELPVTGRVVTASPERPYLSLRLELDPALVGAVMLQAGISAPRTEADARALVVSPLEPELLDATVRLLRLLDAPDEAAMLGPLVKQEIVYRLLTGEQGNRLRHLPLLSSHSHRIAKAIERLRSEFDRPLRIDALASDLGMSVSGFHHHFKSVTDMSPLQFQKQLRLQAARQLMLGEHLDAASAAFRVGYQDTSQFSREYKRHFGAPPSRDVERFRRGQPLSV